MLLDEVLYMEVRVFRRFLNKYKIKAKDAYHIFEENDIWGYIEACYETLHMSGDDYVINDIQEILQSKGVVLSGV